MSHSHLNRGDGPSPAARPPRRTHYLDLSPAPAFRLESDAGADRDPGPDAWPAWTDLPVDGLLGAFGLVVLDEDGSPVRKGA